MRRRFHLKQHNATWHFRFWHDGKVHERSTQQRDEREAMSIAETFVAALMPGVAPPKLETNRLQLEGHRFGYWTVLSRRDDARTVLCRCDCGLEKLVRLTHLRSGGSRGCRSCTNRDAQASRWLSRPKATERAEYKVWRGIQTRCHNPRSKDYPRYGGRGIRVCAAWRESFHAFIADVGPRPPGHSIERIDNDRGYEPGNVRWATAKEQARNRRDNHRLTINGRTQCLKDWATELGMKVSTLSTRVRRGQDPLGAKQQKGDA